jgi:hypothetical protein
VNLFVDANVLLGFFGLPPRELEELRKLLALIEQGDLTLWVPSNLQDEFERNRSRVLAEATKALKDSRLRVTFPEISSGLAQREALEEAVKDAQRKHSILLEALSEVISNRDLEADAIISELFEKARVVASEGYVGAARDRRDMRRPPGKSDSLGDAVNWETLLGEIPDKEDLYLVSADNDFKSPLQDDTLHDYLAKEWSKKKNSVAHLYRDLGSFSKTHFPELKLADDLPKIKTINQLASSGSFAETHAVVGRLANYDVFTPEQARLLARAAAENSQVRWIATDTDVYELLQRVIEAHRDHLDGSIVSVLEAAMHPPADESVELDEDDYPF